MNSLRSMLSNVRIRTRNPRAQLPSDRTLLLLLSTQVQNLLTESNLRGRYWAVDETDLTVTPNSAEYLIPVENFGKPIGVRSVNQSNPSYVPYDVDFFELGDLGFEWPFPNNFALAGSIDGSPHSTQRIAFYRKAGNVYARVMPTPSQAGGFKLLYQVGKFGETVPLDEDIMLPEFSHLIELRTAIAALPHCEWFDEEARNEARRRELALTLIEGANSAYRLFKSYVATQTANNQPNYRISDSIDD